MSPVALVEPYVEFIYLTGYSVEAMLANGKI